MIAQQVLSIQQAIVQDVKTFEFDGNMIPLNKGFGVFITMNPGYAGRTEVLTGCTYSSSITPRFPFKLYLAEPWLKAVRA